VIANLSVVLPVINERLNLETLIPDIFSVCSDIKINCEIIVVDDGSTDGTDLFISNLQKSDSRVSRVDRSSLQKSLPDSLNSGIAKAQYEHVLWMDADGSMPASTVGTMVASFNGKQNTDELIVVGSRFVPGGGFKGSGETGKTGLLQARRNLKATNDSFTAMILSRILNQYLYLALKRCCKDPATGFVLTSKKHLTANPLQGSYGDYCPRFLYESHLSKIEIVEIPYICLPRQFGVSKTGSNLLQLIKRGLPYVVMPLKIRFSR
jgi:glycosyltransferase involved in cell wall biosynthesis